MPSWQYCRLGPLKEARFMGMGVVKIQEGFLEEVPIQDKQSGSLALLARGAKRSHDKDV